MKREEKQLRTSDHTHKRHMSKTKVRAIITRMPGQNSLSPLCSMNEIQLLFLQKNCLKSVQLLNEYNKRKKQKNGY